MKKHIAGPVCLLAALLCVSVLLSAVCGTSVYAEGGEDTGKTLEITVVEQIPAEEIEDDDVPLASFDAGRGKDGFRRAAPAAVLLLVTVLYVIFTVRSEKKLSALRMEAARAEERYMRARREARS